jgi:hypothetical protein
MSDKPTLRVSQFATHVTQAAGYIQRQVAEQGEVGDMNDVSREGYQTDLMTIMDQLALREVYAVIPGHFGDEFDVVRVGADETGLRLEIQPRWTRARIIREAVRLGLALGILAGIVALVFGIGHDAGIQDAVTNVQLPTR